MGFGQPTLISFNGFENLQSYALTSVRVFSGAKNRKSSNVYYQP